MPPSGAVKGLEATIVTGFLSAVTASLLLVFLLYHVVRMWRRGVIIYPITVFYLSLLFWDVIEAIGWIVGIRWIQLGNVIADDNICLPQAIIQQLGATGTAISIVGMSWCILHDYVIDAPPMTYRWASAVGLGILSLFQMLDILIPNLIFHGAHRYYGEAGSWCWISHQHFATKIVTEYLWFWTAWLVSFLTAVAYLLSVYCNKPLPAGFLWIGFPIQGNRLLRIGLFSSDPSDRVPRWSLSFYAAIPGRIITLLLPIPIQYFDHYTIDMMNDNGSADADDGPTNAIPLTPTTGTRPSKARPMTAASGSSGTTPPAAILDQANETYSVTTSHDSTTRRANRMFALRLLLFPISYLILIAPLSIVRFIMFRHPDGMAPGWPIFVASCYALEGLVDVFLFIGAGPAFGIDFSS